MSLVDWSTDLSKNLKLKYEGCPRCVSTVHENGSSKKKGIQFEVVKDTHQISSVLGI